MFSFRDPGGRLLAFDNRILRFVKRSGEPDLKAFLASATARKGVDIGRLVSTHSLDLSLVPAIVRSALDDVTGEEVITVFEHERIAFQNFPYEWAPEMLYAAGSLTLDLAEEALAEGFGLKDATPSNVIFRGCKPVFVDLLSFEPRDPNDPVWLPYAQFVRTFLLPILASEQLGLRLDQIFLTRRDGLEPEEVYRLCGFTRRLRRPFLTLASIPTWLAADKKKHSIYEQRRLARADQTKFILGRLFRQLRHQLESVRPRRRKSSTWTDYMLSLENFPPNYIAEKESFLKEVFEEFKPRELLDVGCNTGHFSHVATTYGAKVVAIDQDPRVIGELWRQASAQDLNILPLVVDLTRPSPGVGWRNNEHESFLDRARGAFDAVLMLALVHHLLVSERIPLTEILELASELTRDLLIVEFIEPDDPMFQRLSRGRDYLFEGLTNELFRTSCLKRFHIIRSRKLAATNRWIYLLRKK
jgi:2-polyprenyl-3-methyl-5-hydroxy-6-metoxy-1,4-benzoquinol methylase